MLTVSAGHLSGRNFERFRAQCPLLRLPIFEIMKETVTHPSKVLCWVSFADLFVCRCFHFAVFILKLSRAEEIGFVMFDLFLVDSFWGVVVTCMVTTAQQIHSLAVPVIALNVRSYALRKHYFRRCTGAVWVSITSIHNECVICAAFCAFGHLRICSFWSADVVCYCCAFRTVATFTLLLTWH